MSSQQLGSDLDTFLASRELEEAIVPLRCADTVTFLVLDERSEQVRTLFYSVGQIQGDLMAMSDGGP